MNEFQWMAESRAGGIRQGQREERERCLRILAEIALEYKQNPPVILKEIEYRIKAIDNQCPTS